ncbi:unnamed protein product [Cochlearia groenlandica]
MIYEANARVQDPVYGCTRTISSLHKQLEILQTQLAYVQSELVHVNTLRRFNIESPSYTAASDVTFPTNKDFSSDVDMAFLYENRDGNSLWSC